MCVRVCVCVSVGYGKYIFEGSKICIHEMDTFEKPVFLERQSALDKKCIRYGKRIIWSIIWSFVFYFCKV